MAQTSESFDPAQPAESAEQREESGTDRRSVIDRRSGLDRRSLPASEEATNLERRRGPGRRRTDFMRSAEEGEMTQEQFMFVMAIDAFKRVNRKTFPAWTDVLEVLRKLGYRKTMPTELNLGPRVEDWTERPDASSGVDKPSSEDEE
ncbi:MAG: hypothetical protein ACYTGG_05400 [Planctomycetota bacterium]|jgi:hypothetical protein